MVISALITIWVSASCCLYKQFWDGNATTLACFSDANTTNWRSSNPSPVPACVFIDGDIRLFAHLPWLPAKHKGSFIVSLLHPSSPPPNPHCVHREDSSSQLFYTINHTRNYLRTVALFAFHTVIFPRFVGIRDQGTVTIQEWHRQNASFQLERRSVCEKYRGRERGERRKRLTFHMYTFVKI